MTAIVKLFLKKPNETQELVQTVLSLATQVSPPLVTKVTWLVGCFSLAGLSNMTYWWNFCATQDSDNPDLRDRGYIYWRLLSTDPAAAKEVVLAEKPLISEETDLLEPTLLDELICHIGSLASVSQTCYEGFNSLTCSNLSIYLSTNLYASLWFGLCHRTPWRRCGTDPKKHAILTPHYVRVI